MIQKTLPALSDKPAISIKALRDLSIEGWDRQEVTIKTRNEQSLIIQLNGEILQITCMEDAEMNAPSGAVLDIDKVGGDGEFKQLDGVLNIQSISGDAKFENLTAGLVIRQVGGDLKMEKVPSAHIEKISGDAWVKSVEGPLSVRHIGGDLDMEDIGSSRFEKISGDCTISKIHGDTEIQRTGGDFNCKDVQGGLVVTGVGGDFNADHIQGNLAITNVGGDSQIKNFQGGLGINSTGGDFNAEHVEGSLTVQRAGGDAELADISAIVRVQAGGDIHAGLTSGSSLDCLLKAGGDLTIALNPTTLANLNITSHSHSIFLEFGDGKSTLEQLSYQAEIGAPSSDEARKTDLVFTAGGDVHFSAKDYQGEPPKVTGQSSGKDRAKMNNDFGFSGFGKDFNFFDAEKFSANIHETVTRQVDQATRLAEEQIKGAMKMVESIQKNPFGPLGRVPAQPSDPGMQAPNSIPQNPEKASITDEERLMILQMVKDQKISVEEAEKLLQALEGQGR